MVRSFFIFLLFISFISVRAQSWEFVDSGVGLIAADENYHSKLKIVERNTVFDLKDLEGNGALNGKYRGNQLFAAWLVGPPTSRHVNNYGKPVWMYKYRITYPDGKSAEHGPFGFYFPGFTYTKINTESFKEGNWKIEWYIVHRDTKETRLVATNEFKTIYGKPE